MRLLQENISFFNKLAGYYDRGILHFWLNRILKRSLKEIKIKNNSVILDAGCGTGSLLHLLGKNKTLKLYGIDISRKMLETARKKLGRKANLRLVPVENFRDKKKFDYIFSTEAFHHYENQSKTMRNFNFSLKRRGKLVIIDLNFGRVLNWIFHKLEPGNSRMNSKEDFYNLFDKHGFKNIRQRKLGIFVIMSVGER